MGVVKSQLSPFNWKTILVLVLAVGALFFAFRLFGKFNTSPEAVAASVPEQVQNVPQQMPQQMEAPPQYQQQQPQPEEDTQGEQAVANE